jgi:hypothetical protein
MDSVQKASLNKFEDEHEDEQSRNRIILLTIPTDHRQELERQIFAGAMNREPRPESSHRTSWPDERRRKGLAPSPRIDDECLGDVEAWPIFFAVIRE